MDNLLTNKIKKRCLKNTRLLIVLNLFSKNIKNFKLKNNLFNSESKQNYAKNQVNLIIELNV